MRKCKCGNQVANNARVCPHCGHRFTSGITKFFAAVFIFSFVFIVIVMLSNSENNVAPTPQTSPIVPASQSMSTGNAANDRLSTLSEREQASFLGKVVNEGCVGNRAFYMGSSPEDRSAFWSVGCTNGKNYLVTIHADAAGSSKVLECSIYKAVTKMSCFTKISN